MIPNHLNYLLYSEYSYSSLKSAFLLRNRRNHFAANQQDCLNLYYHNCVSRTTFRHCLHRQSSCVFCSMSRSLGLRPRDRLDFATGWARAVKEPGLGTAILAWAWPSPCVQRRLLAGAASLCGYDSNPSATYEMGLEICTTLEV